MHAAPDNTFIFDCEQSERYGSKGPFVPCLVTHGTMCMSDAQDRTCGPHQFSQVTLFGLQPVHCMHLPTSHTSDRVR